MRKITNVLILLVSVIISFLVGELLIRIFLNIKFQFKEELPGMRINPFPGLPYDMEECKDCIIRINSLGLRGKEINLTKPIDTIRILMLGDSATFGIKIQNDEETIPGRLEKRLNEELTIKNIRFEVINGGIPGYDIQEIYFHYKYKLKNLNSDIIIYNFFPNDFLNSKFSVKKIGNRSVLVRYVNAELPGLQMLSLLPEKINILLNEYSLLYRYTLFYLSLLISPKETEISNLIEKFQTTNVHYFESLINEGKNNSKIFILSSEIYSFCANCREPLDNNTCPIDKGCQHVFNLIKSIEKYALKKDIPFIYLSEAVTNMDLNDVVIDNFAHYSGRANIKMADRLYDFLKPIILQKFSN
ncbi:MAG: SGNH/GDSL hydrolase family protein [Deltaproteobacteria bacterium]|nr:SGNH/GDSL hydrolase family protein [Deltaproteobacteria bacterium]